MQFEVGKEFTDHFGMTVKITSTTEPNVVFPIRGIGEGGAFFRYTKDGKWNSDGTPHGRDLIILSQLCSELDANAADHFRDVMYADDGIPQQPIIMGDPDYATLAGILQAAHDQAANGKGAERHAEGNPFLDQPIMNIARMLGDTGGHAYQIMKKAQEAHRMVKRDQFEAAEREVLGIINYAAAMILLIREIEFPPEGQN